MLQTWIDAASGVHSRLLINGAPNDALTGDGPHLPIDHVTVGG
jgi:hypothetical protein